MFRLWDLNTLLFFFTALFCVCTSLCMCRATWFLFGFLTTEWKGRFEISVRCGRLRSLNHFSLLCVSHFGERSPASTCRSRKWLVCWASPTTTRSSQARQRKTENAPCGSFIPRACSPTVIAMESSRSTRRVSAKITGSDEDINDKIRYTNVW